MCISPTVREAAERVGLIDRSIQEATSRLDLACTLVTIDS
jgi:hypothetical protein